MTMLRNLTPADLVKTALGLVDSFDAIFKDVRRVPAAKGYDGRNTYAYAPGEVFLATAWPSAGKLPRSTDPAGKWVLGCTPVIQLPDFPPYRAPSDSQPWRNRPCESIGVNYWPHHDMFLVLANDPNHMRNVWLAFVPGTASIHIPD